MDRLHAVTAGLVRDRIDHTNVVYSYSLFLLSVGNKTEGCMALRNSCRPIKYVTCHEFRETYSKMNTPTNCTITRQAQNTHTKRKHSSPTINRCATIANTKTVHHKLLYSLKKNTHTHTHALRVAPCKSVCDGHGVIPVANPNRTPICAILEAVVVKAVMSWHETKHNTTA